jgi:DNA helicase HerA-like ATPase
LLFGLDPRKHFADAPPPWKESYEERNPSGVFSHRITILDLSELASEVLENVTALLGRLVLEFMQRNPERGKFPVVLVLEEAHHYIPANARLERQQRAREVFEKIAKEGRKFGLSLVVASQRPSELSRTVLAQCTSFIVHRIQNPDDQEYFKSVISGINRELLDQLPALAQQQAIVLGDCVALPLQVRINTVDPRPRSDDPPFTGEWSNPKPILPDIEAIAARWGRQASVPTRRRWGTMTQIPVVVFAADSE